MHRYFDTRALAYFAGVEIEDVVSDVKAAHIGPFGYVITAYGTEWLFTLPQAIEYRDYKNKENNDGQE